MSNLRQGDRTSSLVVRRGKTVVQGHESLTDNRRANDPLLDLRVFTSGGRGMMLRKRGASSVDPEVILRRVVHWISLFVTIVSSLVI